MAAQDSMPPVTTNEAQGGCRLGPALGCADKIMTTNKILNTISNAGICDVETLRKVLADGSARKYRNLGEKTYLEMCKLYFVEPFVEPKTPEEVERSRQMRRWKMLARRKMTPAKKVKKLEKQIEKLKAQLNPHNVLLTDGEGGAS